MSSTHGSPTDSSGSRLSLAPLSGSRGGLRSSGPHMESQDEHCPLAGCSNTHRQSCNQQVRSSQHHQQHSALYRNSENRTVMAHTSAGLGSSPSYLVCVQTAVAAMLGFRFVCGTAVRCALLRRVDHVMCSGTIICPTCRLDTMGAVYLCTQAGVAAV